MQHQDVSRLSELWIQHMRRNSAKTTLSWSCVHCLDRQIFTSEETLWSHALSCHTERLPTEDDEALENFRRSFIAESGLKQKKLTQQYAYSPNKNDSQLRKPIFNEADSVQPEPPPIFTKRLLSTPPPFPPRRTLSGLSTLNISTPPRSDDVTLQDVSDDDDNGQPPPRGPKESPIPAPYPSTPGEYGRNDINVRVKKKLWTPDQGTCLTRSAIDPVNIASIQANKSRAQAHPLQVPAHRPQDKTNNIPRTRPISQEQLVAEVKGIYADLAMIEAKSMEVYNRQAKLEAFVHPSSSEEIRRNGVSSRRTFPWTPDVFLEYSQALHRVHNQKSRSQSYTRRPENRRKVLPIQIGNQTHLACPDSGSGKNMTNLAFVAEKKFKMRRGPKDIKPFELGTGKIVWSVGKVFMPVNIPGYPLRRKKQAFYVLRNCPVPLVLGMPFLEKIEVLTKNRDLLKDCPPEISEISSLLWIGSPRNRMKCTMNGHDLIAVADTGSDLNLISLNCAKREGFRIDRRREARKRIMLGDGTETETVGQVYITKLGLDWRNPVTAAVESDPIDFGKLPVKPKQYNGKPQPETPIEAGDGVGIVFHVLPGLPADVVFGRHLLETTDAFNLCPDLTSTQANSNDNLSDEFNILIDLGPVSQFFSIFRRNRRSTQPVDPKEEHDSEQHAEFSRRYQRDVEIEKLIEAKQEAASKEEEERRRVWATKHVACVYCTPV